MIHKISTKQIKYSVSAFIIASSLLLLEISEYSKNQSWIPIIIAFAVSCLIVFIYIRLVKNHPGLSLFEINEKVFGTLLGKCVSALYIFFFFSLTVFNTQELGYFVKMMVLPGTPLTVIFVIFLLLCSYSVRKGAGPMTRYAAILTFGSILALVFNGVLIINKMHLENLLPVFTVPIKNYLLSAHYAAMVPFCEILPILTLAAYVQKPSEIGKALMGGLAIGAAVLLFIILRDIVVLGDYIASIPTFLSVRLIDVGDVLTRLEIVYAVILMSMMFFKVSILLFSTVSGVGKLFNIEQFKYFISIIGVLVIIGANSFFLSSTEHTKWHDAIATYSTFFLFVIPVVTLIVSMIKKSALKRKTAEAPQI